MKRFFALFLAVAMLLTVVSAFAEEAPVLLATVNGREITTDDSNYHYFLDQYESTYGPLEGEDLQYAKALSLEGAIQYALIAQKAAEKGYGEATEEEQAMYRAEVELYWNEQISGLLASNYGITDASTEAEVADATALLLTDLEAQGVTKDAFIDSTVEGYLSTYPSMCLVNELTKDITVTDDEILAAFNEAVEEDKANYEGNVFMYEFYTSYYGQSSVYVPEGYRGILHILLDVDDGLLNNYTTLVAAKEEQDEAATADESAEEEAAEEDAAEEAAAEATEAPAEPVTDEQIEAARKAILDSVQPTVDEIMTKFNAGTSFQDLIAEYNTDPGMQNPATLAEGYKVHADSFIWDSDFTAGSMALKNVGDVSEPVLSSFGVHILYYLRDIPAGAVEFTDELKAQYRETALTDKQNDAYNTAVDGYVAEAEIVYSADGQAIMDAYNALLASEEEDLEVETDEVVVEAE